MPSPFLQESAIKRARWLLLLPPCLPGVLMLVVGWARDPLWPAQDATPAMQIQDALARQQADQLYTAGGIALMGGLLMAAFIAWKILRPAPPDEEEDADLHPPN